MLVIFFPDHQNSGLPSSYGTISVMQDVTHTPEPHTEGTDFLSASILETFFHAVKAEVLAGQ